VGFPLRRIDVFVKTSPTSKPKRLVEGQQPAWSPDGHRVAYCVRTGPTTFGHIQFIDVDGSAQAQLTDAIGPRGACPTDWSPDGEKIAATGFGEKPFVVVISKDGKNATRITDGYGARWSPDGKQFLFCRSAEGKGTSGSIWIANSDGTGEAKVIEDNSDVLSPTWFPDGKSIVFSSEREHKHWSAIFRVNTDGSNLAAIADIKHLSLFAPTVSPDGNQVVADGFEDDSREGDVVLLDLSNKRTKVLAHGVHARVIWE